MTDKEVDHLFRIIRSLRAEGKGIIYITQQDERALRDCRRFSVFRDGKYIATCTSSEVTRDDIIRMMVVGREITQMFPKETVPIGEVVLSVKGLTLDGVFWDVSFDLRAERFWASQASSALAGRMLLKPFSASRPLLPA